jgi:hypothetical protein
LHEKYDWMLTCFEYSTCLFVLRGSTNDSID